MYSVLKTENIYLFCLRNGEVGGEALAPVVCVVATELALVQCFAIRFLTNPKTIMQS